jgi:hypothetical protein
MSRRERVIFEVCAATKIVSPSKVAQDCTRVNEGAHARSGRTALEIRGRHALCQVPYFLFDLLLRSAAKRTKMGTRMSASNRMKNILVILSSLALLFPLAVRAQEKSPDSKGKADSTSNSVRLTIVVTNAEDKKPVDSASVYVKYVQGRLLGKDKKIEMNLKTNLSGVVHVPEIPRGKFLIQVIAPGWKTFGEYYEVDQAEQTINIELARPPKWY